MFVPVRTPRKKMFSRLLYKYFFRSRNYTFQVNVQKNMHRKSNLECTYCKKNLCKMYIWAVYKKNVK